MSNIQSTSPPANSSHESYIDKKEQRRHRLEEQDFYSDDHLMKFLRKTLRLNKPMTLVGIIILAGIVFLGLAGDRFNERYGPIHNMIDSLRKTLGLIPLGFAIYLYLPAAIAHLFNTLRDNHVPVDKDEGTISFDQLIERLRKTVNAGILEIGALAIVLIYIVVRLEFIYSPDKRPLELEIAALLVYSLALYGALIGIARLFIMMRYSNTLFREFNIRVNPLHPDGAAGLAVLGRMLTMSITIAAAIALIIVVGMITPHPVPNSAFMRPEPWFVAGIYTFLIPTLFFGWLWLPHKAMIEARDRRLQPLADRFLESVEAAQIAEGDNAELTKARTEKLTELKRQYELLRDTYPVWPIRVQQVSRIIAIASTPLISTFISDAIDRVLKK